MLVHSLQQYEPSKVTSRGRGRPSSKVIQDVDRTKVNEVIHDRKSPDVVRGETKPRKVID